MGRQRLARFLDRFDERTAEFFILEMRAHRIDESLPEFAAAFLVDRLVAYHSKLMRAGRDENEYSIAFACFVHSETMKSLLRGNQRIDIQFSTLNIHADLAGGF